MATRKKRGDGPTRSDFIRDQLKANPNVSAKDVQDAWAKAGHKPALKTTLFYLIKGKLGLSKRRKGKGRRGRRRAEAAVVAQAAASPNGSYLDIERALDKLIHQADEIGDRKLADALRQARRRASTALI